MGKVLFLGGPVDGETRDVSSTARTFRVIDNGIYEYRAMTFYTKSGQVEAFVWGDVGKIGNALERVEDFARVPSFLLGDSPATVPASDNVVPITREPTNAELGAALLAYDRALPANVERPHFVEHGIALRAALMAAFRMGE